MWNYDELLQAIKEGTLYELYAKNIPHTHNMYTCNYRGKLKLTCKEFTPYEEFLTELHQTYKQITLTGRSVGCGFFIKIDARNAHKVSVEGHIEYNHNFEV